MKPYEIRTEIAKHLGWTKCRLTVRGAGAPERNPSPYGVPPGKNYECAITPFERDLNAMHEAEETLNEKQQIWYLQKLTQVRFRQGVGGMIGCMIDKTTFATAAQRAEAFLRTIGKWSET